MAVPKRTTVSGLLQMSQYLPDTAVLSGQGNSIVHTGTAGAGLERPGITPVSTQQLGTLIKTEPKTVTSGLTKGTIDTKPIAQLCPMASSKIPQSPGPSPRKRVKLEETPPANQEIAAARKLILDERYTQMRELKENYIEHLTECFFLQSGQTLMDFHPWKKRPTPQLVQFLKSGRLDSDDDEENPLVYLQDTENKEGKVLLTSGSNIHVTTPVAVSTTPSVSVSAFTNQVTEMRKPGVRHGMVYSQVHQNLPIILSTTVAIATTVALPPAAPVGRTESLATTTVSTAAGYLHRSVSDTKLVTMTAHSTKTVMSTSQSGTVKQTPPGSPSRNKQSAGFDGTNITGITTQEAIVERAKQEAQVMSRVSELRKEGLWSSRRLPKVQEPSRNKAHWDYLLEEMQWLAADFAQERKWKKAAARKLAKMVQKHFQDLEQKELKAEKEEGMKLKRIAGQMAKMIKEFWANIEKVVQYKQQSRLDEKRKKALDLHLNFIVDQTEKYSSWLTEGLKTSSKGSLNTTPDSSIAGDDEFKPEDSESDDEETIEKDEEGIDESETKDEVAALQKESEVPLDELLESLPKEILEKSASVASDKEETDKNDEEFEADEDSEIDVEETIEEQERHERRRDVKEELDDLKDEGEMDIEELRAKYAAAYDSDFEMPEESDNDVDDESGDDDLSSEEGESEDEDEEEQEVDVEGEDVGLEALVHSAENAERKKEFQPGEEEEGPGKQLTDIAAEAASLQPKGYTLQTTEVKTKVPFLLKHTLREYQHVGLDWLATMYEKRLNGILADEMGLGKTIQTIALLAHLACEKGIWGPHLIVVPTSVMLNWEMEFKKWCPAFKILTYYGNQKERKLKRMGWTKTNAFHICITSYKLVIQDHQSFRRKKWKYLILDEAQNIKNFKSQRWQTLLNFNSLRRLLLTGTPLQNSLMELWSLMHFLMPQVFQSHREFKEWFANPLTGMIEGSHEYNEKLIHRLHKVLRPFLLRRLKDDVEKQMPKKYEHVVMCHLAKRQRFLYDEFMGQTKTKETLASGHFMSVINILMQLRKVCNHPSLFDPRPIVSPLQMEGLVYNTASLVLNALQYDPLENIDIRTRYPTLADMEKDLPAFIAHRVRKLQTPGHLIEEIDSQPFSPPRPPAGKLKSGIIRCISPGIPSGRASPQIPSRAVSPTPFVPVTENSEDAQASFQAKTQSVGSATSASTTQPATSQAITVQIQRTDQGTRFVVPSGFLQIVQTSTGQHLIATSTAPSSVAPVISPSSTVANGEPVVTMATSSVKTTVSSVVSQVKMSPSQNTSSSSTVQLPESSTVQDSNKPVMRVSPLITAVNGHQNHDGVIFTTASTSATTTVPVLSGRTMRTSKHTEDLKKLRKQEFFMEPLYVKRRSRRKEKLDYIVETNKKHCDVKPVYGRDLCDAVNIFIDPYNSKQYVKRDRTLWHGPGQIHCHCAKFCQNQGHPKYSWNQTKVLSDVIHTPEQYLAELEEILDRFVFVIPPVQCPPLRMHVSHPSSTYLQEERLHEHLIHTELSNKASNYHKISTKMTVQFPELRLIQYDCGKLQTLDILLRQLKSEDHRVLIFTQMTKMLNILESFLNYHGHRYLRLDGTTKVEQRQQLMDRFNADKRIFCFILSTRSGGLGVNLTGADTVIFYDSDWNPTMDAQAQDRCHRIGQTRDVHIYRLISERTVEENILKKANQKRMLGDMAIEGGNFTTTFFQQQTISELFLEPSGLDSLVKEREEEEREKQERAEKAESDRKAESDTKVESEKKKDEEETEVKIDSKAMVQFEKALAKTEDETDAISAEKVKAEQKAELAEFDENIPWDEQEAASKEDDDSRVEKELAMLEKELSPIERYAVQFAELQMEPVNAEELLIAEEDIVNAKKDWELNRLKALKEEEERRLELEEDEMLYTYSRDDAYLQVKKRNKQLVLAHRRAAAAAKADALSPVRKSVRLSMGSTVDSEPESAYKSSANSTPKLITGKGRGRKSLQLTPKITPKASPKSVVGKLAKAGGDKLKSVKKSKAKIKMISDCNDNGEEIDVETVGKDEEIIKQPKRSNKKTPSEKKNISEKALKKANRRSPKIVLTHVSTGSSHSLASCNTDATPLQALPGFSRSNPIDVDATYSPNKLVTDSVQGNIFEKLSPVKQTAERQKILPIHDRGNIFEQFSQSFLHGRAAGANLVPSPISTSNVRLINTQHGRQMVVVSASNPVQPTPQNLVLVQGMQGLPQGLIFGNNLVPLQGTPLNMATLTRGASSVGLSGARLSASPQVVNPQFTPQIQTQPNQAFVQRLVNVQHPSATGNLPNLSGLSLGSVQQLTGLTVPRSAGQIVSNIGQVNPQHVRLPTTNIQSLTALNSLNTHSSQSQQTPRVLSPRKSPSHTIADLIEARNAAKSVAKTEKTTSIHYPAKPVEQGSSGSSKNVPNLGNIMKAQVPAPYKLGGDTEGKVRVNPTVAQLVASHINAVAAQSEGGQSKVSKPAIITASSTTRAASPTVVKLVAASSLRAGSPVGKTQVFLSDIDGEEMPTWSPPTPPHDENDVYIDKTLHFLYEPTVMPETQLPPVYVKKEKKKIKVESITTRTQKQKRQEQPRVPRSLFDRPTAQLLKLRRDAKIQKLKQGQLKLYRPMPSMPPKPIMDSAPDHPEWLIHEDWALLQAVQSLFDVPLNLMIVSPAHTPNWDMVADVVNSCSRVYRSPKQCRLRYENVIIPREEGRILYDMNPRKQKKTKGIYKMTTKNNRPMKTSQIHGQDSNNGVTLLYSLRFDSVKSIATKRPPTMRQTLVNPTQKNPKHASVLQENSITYDHPLNPMQVAEIRAQRIQREKKQNQQQQATAVQQAQGTDQSAVSTAASVTQRSAQIATITPPQVSAATLVAVTSGVTTQQLATLGTVSSTAAVLTVTGVPPVQTAVRQKTPIQEISSGITATVPVPTSQVRAQLQTGTTTVTTGLTQVQLAQRISAATTLASGATVQQQFQAAGKTLTPQQYQQLRKQQQQQQVLHQQQQLRMQRLTLVSPDQLKQQPFRQLKGSVIQGGQKTLIAQQLVTSIPPTVKQGQLKAAPGTTLARPFLTHDELNKLKQQQLVQQQKLGQVPAGQPVAGTSGSVAQIQHHGQTGQLQTTQIIAAQGAVQQVTQNLGTVSGSQAATLVKTVSAPAGSVTIPVSNVNISVSMPSKGGLAKINPQQMKQMQLIQQRKPALPVQKTGVATQKAPQMLNAVQIIQQQTGARSLTVHQLQQLMKQQPQTIQQIIHTSQPTIITAVTQGQQQPQQLVTKVVNATVTSTAVIQTITAGSSSSSSTTAPVISLSQVPVPSLSIASVATGQSPVTASIVKPVGGSDGVTTVQIHPVSSLTQSKLVVPQNVVVQPIQQISGSTAGQTHVIQAQSLSQQHGSVAGQGPVHVTLPAAAQIQHVTVATPTQTQQVTVAPTQPSQVNVTVVSQPSTPTPNPGPMTVTVTPAPVTPSPVQTPTQPAPSPVHTPVQAPVTLTYASPSQTVTTIPSSISTQPVAVTDQTVQQTVAAVLQPRQQTPAPSQPSTPQGTTQVQVQTPSGTQTQPQPQAQTQQTVQAPQTGAVQQSTVQSPQSAGKPAPYAMRTRKQSERQ